MPRPHQGQQRLIGADGWLARRDRRRWWCTRMAALAFVSAAVPLLLARPTPLEADEPSLVELAGEVRALRLVLGAGFLVAGALLVSPGVLRGPTVEAGRIVLRDERGRLRVGLSPEAGLVLLDEAQAVRAELAVRAGSAGLRVCDATGSRRVELVQGTDGGLVALSDGGAGRRTLLLGVGRDGCSVSLADGCQAAAIAVGSDRPTVAAVDSRFGRASLDSGPDGPRLVLADGDAVPVLVVDRSAGAGGAVRAA